MTSPARFSVVIPMYNKQDHIAETLESVLAQRRLPDEIIVVDDGSTDGSRAIVERYAPRIRLICQVNRGVAQARNVGIEAARNELVCLLDADDLWLPEYLDEIDRLTTRFPTAEFYGVGHVYLDRGRAIRPLRALGDTFFGEVDFLSTYARGTGIICSSTVCIRRAAFAEGLVFPAGRRVGEDIYYWIQLGLRGAFAFSGKPLARIMRDEKGIQYKSRFSEIPYYIEWLATRLPELPAAASAPLTAILRTRAIQSGLLAAELGDREYVRRLSGLLRPRFPAVALVVQMLGLTPAWSVRLARSVKARLRVARA